MQAACYVFGVLAVFAGSCVRFRHIQRSKVEKNMGIIGMKIPARDRIFSNGGIISMKEAMSYTMSLPISTIIVGIDKIAELEENVQIARDFEPLSADEMLAIEDKVKPHYEHLMFYKGLSNWPEEWSGNNV